MDQLYTSLKPFQTSSQKPNIFHPGRLICLLLLGIFTLPSIAQNKGGIKDVEPRSCIQYIGNGIYRVNFGYDNPNKRDVTLDEGNSIVTRGNGKIKSKGVNHFKAGSVKKAFTLEFNEKETVEWTVINPSGKQFTVTANINSSHCPPEDLGVIFPVYGQENGKSNTLIGLELTALAEGNSGDEPSDIIYQIYDSQKVLIEIVPQPGKLQEVLNLLTATYGLSYSSDPLTSDFIINPGNIEYSIDVFFPIDQLLGLNNYPDIINFVRPLYTPLQNSGVTTSQGDNAQKSNIVREAFNIMRDGEKVPVDGSGIKIGVISDSFDTQPFTGKSRAAVDVENGDLPGLDNPDGNGVPVEVLKDFPYGVATDEGRAMMQVIHDVAPGAALAFNTGVLSPRDFEIAIKDLETAGCNILVDDITFASEPMFGESKISQTIRNFLSEPGRFHVTSAGNFSDNAYQGTFLSSSNLPPINFIPIGSSTVAHVFGNNSNGSEDVFQKIQVEQGTYMLVLQWDENMLSQGTGQGAATDLDIYLVDNSGNLLVGNNRFNISGDPTEFLVFQALGASEANILITSPNGPLPEGLAFRYIAFRAEGLDFLEYGGAPTVTGHAMTPEVVTVGAVDYRNAESPEVQYFSSMAGNLADNTLLEIDFVAPDGGNTNVSSIGQDITADEDDFPNFFGTSASAPHSAAAIALLTSAVNSWYPDGLTSEVSIQSETDQVLALFKNTAIPSGEIEKSGAGLINTENAFKTIAAPTALLTGLAVEEGKTPGTETFEVTISGRYLPDNPTVYFDGKELEIVSTGEGEIKAVVEEFSGNPGLTVYTMPITPSGTDGGESNALYFFDGTNLKIIADDVKVEFGQEIKFSFTVEGLPEGTTFESLGLPEILFTTSANFPYPDVNSYTITPYFDQELTAEQKEDFQITFEDGLLEVTRKDLQIKPKDATFTYGSPITLDFDFHYEPTGINDNTEFLELIRQSYSSSYYTENTLALINNFKALINDLDILSLLNEGSWLSSENVINNKLRAVVNGMNVVDVYNENFIDYVNETTGGTTNYFKAVINKLRAVVNAEDLFSNNVELYIDNKLRAVVNGTELGGENDSNDYSFVFAIIDAEDTSIPSFYSIGLITGLDVTASPDEHYIYPGAFVAPLAYNFNVTYDSGRLTVLPETLHVKSPDLVIYQGETPSLDESSIIITGFAYDDTVESVFPDGIPYYFVDADGNEYQDGDTGVFFIRIREPANYIFEYDPEGKLYVNPSGTGIRKVRTYLDCVEFNPKGTDGLKYTAHFRYENPNSQTIYVLKGPDNFLSGEAIFEGEPPTVFLPGQGTFEVRFDGNNLKWELTTMDSTNKTSTSSDASSSSSKCDSNSSKNQLTAYVVYPNPVSTTLYIDQTTSEPGILEIFNSYGIKYYSAQLNPSVKTHQVDISGYNPGVYVVRITDQYEIFTENIIKE